MNTNLGTKESLRIVVVGSSSNKEAISLPWGTDTKQYTGAFKDPRSLFLIGSCVESLSICKTSKNFFLKWHHCQSKINKIYLIFYYLMAGIFY